MPQIGGWFGGLNSLAILREGSFGGKLKWPISIVFTKHFPLKCNCLSHCTIRGLSRRLRGKESACQCRRGGFHPWIGKIPWRKKWQPPQYSWLENSMDSGDWRATVHGVTKNHTLPSNWGTRALCYKNLASPSSEMHTTHQVVKERLKKYTEAQALPAGTLIQQVWNETQESVFVKQSCGGLWHIQPPNLGYHWNIDEPSFMLGCLEQFCVSNSFLLGSHIFYQLSDTYVWITLQSWRLTSFFEPAQNRNAHQAHQTAEWMILPAY